MKLNIARLNSNIDSSIDFENSYDIEKDKLIGTDMESLKFDISGSIYKNNMNEICLECSINGTMVLPCAITLKPTNYDFSIDIDENLDEFYEKNDKKYNNTIDIFPIIWENILTEVPMRVISEGARDVHIEGDGWKFVTQEEEVKSSPFDELKDLL